MEESVLLGTKPLVDSIRHFIRDPSGVFSVWHLCECHIVQWRHGLLLVSRVFSLHIIKRTLHGGSKIWILSSCGKNNISCHSNIKFISSRHRVISSMYSHMYDAVITTQFVNNSCHSLLVSEGFWRWDVTLAVSMITYYSKVVFTTIFAHFDLNYTF